MMNVFARMYRAFALLVQLPILLEVYLDGETGREYGFGFLRKLSLFLRMQRNTRRVIGYAVKNARRLELVVDYQRGLER